jgi:basic membrane protein A
MSCSKRVKEEGALKSSIVKLMLLGLAALALAAFGTACGSDDDNGGGSASTGESTEQSGGGEAVKTALVMPCPTSDPWCRQGDTAAKKLASEGVIDLEATPSAPQDTPGVARILQQYAQGGKQLILAYSTWEDAADQVAQRFPETNFATFGAETRENVALFEEPIYEAAYLAGMIAGGITKSNKLGGVAGQDIPLCHSELEAFEEGAKRTNDKVEMIDTYVGDWNDIPKSKQAVLTQAEQGADVILACGGAQANAMAEAIKEENISGFGYVGDMSSQAPKNMVGSVIYDPYPYMKAMAEDTANDTFRPAKKYNFGLADGGVSLQLNDQYSVTEIPEDVMKQMQDVEQQIKDGSFEVPNIPTGEGPGG